MFVKNVQYLLYYLIFILNTFLIGLSLFAFQYVLNLQGDKVYIHKII